MQREGEILGKTLVWLAGLTAAAVLMPFLGAAKAQTPAQPRATAEVVVSATKTPEDPVEVAAPVSVVSGEELRRRGTRTVAEALQDVVGLDTGNGSDNGAHLAKIGLWGLKEFDALLVTVDGVPIGGPFNPSLSQINVEDIDRIEIVRGPQGSLYGVSAFAGMIQVFTRRPEGAALAGSVAGGSFSERRGTLRWTRATRSDLRLGVSGSMTRGNGWQDRTDFASDRLTVSAQKKWDRTALDLSLVTYRDTNFFGSPLPVDAGNPLPGFDPDRNYAISGARLDHHVYSLNANFATPITSRLKFENTLGVARDNQISVRSFVTDATGSAAVATGTSLKPVETTVFDDARLVSEFEAAGSHRLVGGAAVTWGRTTAAGTGFRFNLRITPEPLVPRLEDVPANDRRSLADRRTFVGLYVNDAWTPISRLTFSGGVRYDITSESLRASQQDVGPATPVEARDSRRDSQFSGGLSALFRILERPSGPLSIANMYVSAKSNFKPAAPNLSEAASARILEPERTRSGEIGLKTRWFDRTLSFDVTLFHMIFENLVVGVRSPAGQPALTNAGEERFQGAELELHYLPAAAEGLSLSAGYAHHDARFIRFSFFNAEGNLRVVDGKRLELVPRDLWNVGLAYAPALGPGGFIAARHQNRRPLNRRNTFFTDSFFETDAGASWDFRWGRLAVVGRNLGDSRHYIADSEIGDSQFYVAPPRRFSAELTVRF